MTHTIVFISLVACLVVLDSLTTTIIKYLHTLVNITPQPYTSVEYVNETAFYM